MRFSKKRYGEKILIERGALRGVPAGEGGEQRSASQGETSPFFIPLFFWVCHLP